MVSYKLCLLCKKHHCQKDGWCLQKGIFLQNEGHEKSMSAHYQLFLSLQGHTLSLVKLVQWWKFGFYKMLLLFGASRFRLCPTILYPSKFLVSIHFVGFFQCPPFCVYKGGVWPHGANFNGDSNIMWHHVTPPVFLMYCSIKIADVHPLSFYHSPMCSFHPDAGSTSPDGNQPLTDSWWRNPKHKPTHYWGYLGIPIYHIYNIYICICMYIYIIYPYICWSIPSPNY